jgi:hypothetical protein
MDITETLTPKSDQLNAEDLLTGSRTVTVEKVTKGSVEQPVDIHLVEFPGRPFRPSKTSRRLLVAAWGAEASAYTGHRMTLYRDPEIKFGAEKVGGIRISHLSHIDKPLTISLTETRGKRKPHRIEPLPDAPATTPDRLGIGALFDKGGLPKDRSDDRMIVTRKIIGRDVAAYADLSTADVDALQVQLTTWDLGGELVDKLSEILDMAAIQAESEGGEK